MKEKNQDTQKEYKLILDGGKLTIASDEDDKENTENSDDESKELLKKLQEQAEANKKDKEQLEKNKSLLENVKELFFGKKQKKEKSHEEELEELLKKKNKKETKGTEENDDKDEKSKETKESNDETVLKIIKGLQGEIQELKKEKEKTKRTRELNSKGLETEFEQNLFEHLYEEAMEGQKEGYEMPEKDLIKLISNAKTMAEAKNAKEKERTREDLYAKLTGKDQSNPINTITLQDYQKMTIAEKQQLNEVNPIIYNALSDQEKRQSGMRFL